MEIKGTIVNRVKRFMVAVIAINGLMPSNYAYALTVNFEDVPIETTGHFSSDGFDFSLTGTYVSAVVRDQTCSPPCPVNGTNIVLAPYGIDVFVPLQPPTSLTMMKSDGGSFRLSGFDGAGSFNLNEWRGSPQVADMYNQRFQLFTKQIDVVASITGGSTLTQSFLVDITPQSGPLPFTSFVLNTSFANLNLSSVTFTSSSSIGHSVYSGFAIDNVVAVPIPEPETYAMMMAGLGFLGFMAKRKKSA